MRIVGRGKDYLRLVPLGRGVFFWLLSTVDEVVELDNSLGFIQNFTHKERSFA